MLPLLRRRHGGQDETDGCDSSPATTTSAPYYVRRDDGSQVEIIAAARAAGWEDLPGTSAREPDDVEQAIEREHRRRHREALEQARGELRNLADEFDRLEQDLPGPRDLQVAVE